MRFFDASTKRLLPFNAATLRHGSLVVVNRSGFRQLARKGVTVARCTVGRLMRKLGLRGVMRGKVVRTTVSDGKAPCPLVRVNR